MPKRTALVDYTGRTAEVVFDPKSGQWYNTETGNPFNVETYEKDFLPHYAENVAFINEQRRKLETRATAFDRMLDAAMEDKKRRTQLLEQLLKWRPVWAEKPGPSKVWKKLSRSRASCCWKGQEEASRTK